MLPLLFIACNKNGDTLSGEQAVSLRSENTPDISWLTGLQSYLKDLRDNINTSANTYSEDEVVYGVETLFNLKYSRFMPDKETTFLVDSFEVNLSVENYYDLFTKVEDIIDGFNLDDKKIVGISIEMKGNESSNSKYFVTGITSGGESKPLGFVYDPCGFFDEDESYFLGLGELAKFPYEDDSPSVWLDCYGYGHGECGGLDENKNMVTTACTRIQEEMNFRKPNGIFCGEGVTPFIFGHYDVTRVQLSLDDDCMENGNPCYFDDFIPSNLSTCMCLDSKMLNHSYACIDHSINNQIKIPYSFVSLDLGVDFAPSLPSDHNYSAIFMGELYKGIAFCFSEDDTVFKGPILEVNLDNINFE